MTSVGSSSTTSTEQSTMKLLKNLSKRMVEQSKVPKILSGRVTTRKGHTQWDAKSLQILVKLQPVMSTEFLITDKKFNIVFT